MKLYFSSCIALAIAVTKASADCFSTKLGYPCCSSSDVEVLSTDENGQWSVENDRWCGIPSATNNNLECTGQDQGYSCCNTCEVATTDGDGAWGIENGVWCGIRKSCNQSQQPQPQPPTSSKECTGQDQGYTCCNTCEVNTTDGDGAWGIENGQWCGIRYSCGGQQRKTTTTTKRTTTTTTTKTPEPTSGVPLNPPPVTNGRSGKTTRYWDCCVASCAWDANTNAKHPVNVCEKNGITRIQGFDYRTGSVCTGGSGYMCNDNQPWAINENVSYGFVAAGFDSGNQKEWCCTCQRLQFTSGSISGKQMVVQITNTGTDLTENHFDIQMPGGGVGIYNGCSAQWGAGNDGWGQRYGGISSSSECSQLPPELQAGCKWRFDWFKNSDNPRVTFERVQCPKELTDISGCIPVDDANAKPLPW
eukprot:jgi/Orpsp1_1/1186105/evm.model.c7180000096916.1